jgi:hypothetical protein
MFTIVLSGQISLISNGWADLPVVLSGELMMSVFLCYSKDDRNRVRRIRDSLLDKGIEVWMDVVDITPGANWQKTIETSIRECSHLIVFLSDTAIKSPEVEAEWNLALDLDKTVVPIRTKEVEVPFRLRSRQAIDFDALGAQQAIEYLVKALPKRDAPKHLVFDNFKAGVHKHHKQYAFFAGIHGPDQRIAMNPSAYMSFAQMLDDMFSHYLSNVFAPYSYGEEWILSREKQLLVPLVWVTNRGKAVSKICPTWASHWAPSELSVRPGSFWHITSGSSVCDTSWGVPYGIATNNDEMAKLLLSEIKSIGLFYREGYISEIEITDSALAAYRHQYVFKDWLRIGLGEKIWEGSSKPLTKRIQDVFAYRRR